MEQSNVNVKSYTDSKNLRLLTFSYLPGCDLFHKIALTSKSIRKKLPKSGLLDQVKVITIKESKDSSTILLSFESFLYAWDLANSIQLQMNPQNINAVKSQINTILFARAIKSKPMAIYLMAYQWDWDQIPHKYLVEY